MSKYTLPGWRPTAFLHLVQSGYPLAMQLFREIRCTPIATPPGATYRGLTFTYRTDAGDPPPEGTVIRLWLANAFGEIVLQTEPIPVQASPLVAVHVSIPFQQLWSPEAGLWHILASSSVESGTIAGVLLNSCFGLIGPVDGSTETPGSWPLAVGEQRYTEASNPAVDGLALGSVWPARVSGAEAHHLPLIMLEEA